MFGFFIFSCHLLIGGGKRVGGRWAYLVVAWPRAQSIRQGLLLLCRGSVCVCVYIAIISRALAYCSVFLLFVGNLLERRKQIIKGEEGERERKIESLSSSSLVRSCTLRKRRCRRRTITRTTATTTMMRHSIWFGCQGNANSRVTRK
jgi:hypothetical protein